MRWRCSVLFYFTACMHLWPVCKLPLWQSRYLYIPISMSRCGEFAMKKMYKMRSEIHTQNHANLSFPITGRRFITAAMANKPLFKDTN